MARFSPQASALLERAGWHDGRDEVTTLEMSRSIAREGGFVMSEAATRVLLEFGGLRVGRTGANHAPSKIDFTPTLAMGEEARFSMWRDDRRPALFPLGEIDGGHAYLAIHADGSVYAVGDEWWRIASAFDEAVEVLTRGLGWESVPEIPTLARE